MPERILSEFDFLFVSNDYYLEEDAEPRANAERYEGSRGD